MKGNSDVVEFDFRSPSKWSNSKISPDFIQFKKKTKKKIEKETGEAKYSRNF